MVPLSGPRSPRVIPVSKAVSSHRLTVLAASPRLIHEHLVAALTVHHISAASGGAAWMEETQAGDDYMAMGQNRGTLVHIKIDGIYGWEHPTNTLMIIGFDTHPYHSLRTGKSSLKQWI